MDWLLILFQLPARPAYMRVKIGRKLQVLGAVPIKNAAYALPLNDAAIRAFAELHQEVTENGGEALVCEARFLEGLSDKDARALFDEARDADYEELVRDARALMKSGAVSPAEARRLHKRREAIAKIDFFSAHGRQAADSALAELDGRIAKHPDVSRTEPAPAVPRGELKNRVWVTRRDIHVDRIASAWLIQRFLDPAGSFKFVDGKGYVPAAGELRFDMADAEFTHEGDNCTFETLLKRANLDSDPGLRALAEIIHDLDIEDEKFRRPETAGLGALVSGVCRASDDDSERVKLGASGLDQFYAHFRKG